MSAAILFSNPSSFRFENGMFSGSGAHAQLACCLSEGDAGQTKADDYELKETHACTAALGPGLGFGS